MAQKRIIFIGIAKKCIVKVADRVELNPKIMMGKPVIRGTRIPVELILRRLSEGASERELLDAYPQLQKEDIKAALAYAADTIAHERLMPLGPSETSGRK